MYRYSFIIWSLLTPHYSLIQRYMCKNSDPSPVACHRHQIRLYETVTCSQASPVSSSCLAGSRNSHCSWFTDYTEYQLGKGKEGGLMQFTLFCLVSTAYQVFSEHLFISLVLTLPLLWNQYSLGYSFYQFKTLEIWVENSASLGWSWYQKRLFFCSSLG